MKKDQPLKKGTIVFWTIGTLFLVSAPLLFIWLESALAQTNPITITWVTPTNGQTVSGIIPLTVNVSSTGAPIQRVEFYRDGQLIGVKYAPLPAPQIQIVTTP